MPTESLSSDSLNLPRRASAIPICYARAQSSNCVGICTGTDGRSYKRPDRPGDVPCRLRVSSSRLQGTVEGSRHAWNLSLEVNVGLPGESSYPPTKSDLPVTHGTPEPGKLADTIG